MIDAPSETVLAEAVLEGTLGSWDPQPTLVPVEPPLSATDLGGMQVLLHWTYWYNGGQWFAYIDGEGRVIRAPAEDIRVDFRFTRDGKWIDVGPAEMLAAAGPGLSFARDPDPDA